MSALHLDGTGYLEYPAKIVSAFPYSMSIWVSRDAATGAGQWVMGQMQSNGDRHASAWLDPNGSTKYASIRNPGAQHNATDVPATITSNLQLMVVVFESTSLRHIYFAGNTSDGTTTCVDDTSLHDRFVVGAWHYNSLAPQFFLNGKVAEPHLYNGILSPTQIAALLNDTVKPEDTVGWVDGWTLKNFDSGGTYTSISGTRTLTAVGGVTAAGVAHPITRAAPSQTLTAANCTQANTSSTGAISQTTPPPGVNLVSATCTQVNNSSSVAISQSGGTTGTITHRPLGRNGHNSLSPQLWTNETGLTIHYRSMTTGLTVLSKTGWTTNSAGVPPAVTDSLLVPGTSYEIMFILANGVRGFDVLAAV
jgi:hypothetical protein